MNIEQVFAPKQYKLMNEGTKKDPQYYTEFCDEELDVFKCSFKNDGCLTIDANGMSYIVLEEEAINKLLDLLHKAELKYQKYYGK
jgi:hypothetical protein